MKKKQRLVALALSSFSRLSGVFMSASKWEPILWPDWEALTPPRELWVGPKDPLMHYFRWVWEYRAYLTLLCDMQADDSVLELGCSHGRTALGLLDYLRAPAR